MVIALGLFLSESIEEDSLLCLLLPHHYMYVLSSCCVCIYELYMLSVSTRERGRLCKCQIFQNLKNCKCFKMFEI